MSTYKVIQDVEAEDKILGPLTLRQFIYAGVSAICLYLTYFLSTHGAAFMSIVFVPIALVMGFFAAPWGRDQPTEVWALARIRFMLIPRRRIWNQSGVKELVTVTAPKTENMNYTDGLSETEVKSRLHALADTLDSRGWAVKNSAVNLYTQPALVMSEPSQERLLDIGDMPQQNDPLDIHDSDDMMDERNNPAAQQMDSMIAASAKAHRQKIVDALNEPEPIGQPAPAASKAPANNYWFLNQSTQQATSIPDDMVTFNTQVVTPGMGQAAPHAPAVSTPAPNEEELVEQLEAKRRELPMAAYYGHLHTIQPLSAQQQQQKAQAQAQAANTTVDAGQQPMQNTPAPQQPTYDGNTTAATPQAASSRPQVEFDENGNIIVPGQGIASLPATDQPVPQQNNPSEPAVEPVTPAQQAAILQLAHNDDLNVATLAREAQRSEAADGEVVIKLH